MTPPLVAFAFHWDYPGEPEGRSAWPHYRYAIEALAADPERPYDLLGHGHPRVWEGLAAWYESIGIEAVADSADVLDRADLLVFDNSSIGYEFASLDKPVVVLNAPWYRREVEHGGRFWEWADVGFQCDHPSLLRPVIAHALPDDHPAVVANRRRIVAEVYSATDGQASERAVDAIHSVIGAAVRRQAKVSTDPYAAKSTVSISGFSPRLDVHPPIPRLVFLGAPPALVSKVRADWEALSEPERLTSVAMFDNLTDDEVRAQIAEGLAELTDEILTAVRAPILDPANPDAPTIPVEAPETDEALPSFHATSAVVLAWVGKDQERARAALDAELAGQQRRTLIRKLEKVRG